MKEVLPWPSGLAFLEPCLPYRGESMRPRIGGTQSLTHYFLMDYSLCTWKLRMVCPTNPKAAVWDRTGIWWQAMLLEARGGQEAAVCWWWEGNGGPCLKIKAGLTEYLDVRTLQRGSGWGRKGREMEWPVGRG